MTKWVIRLIVANVIVFAMTYSSPLLKNALAYVPVYVLIRPWTLITYMFVHDGFGHIFFNMLALFFFGPRLELELGETKFLGLYFSSGIAGALLSSFFAFNTSIIGASGGVFGIMLGFAYYWPKEKIFIYGIFPVQARYLVLCMTILSLAGGVTGSADGVAHFAHLGGYLGGYLFLLGFGRKRQIGSIVKPPSVKVASEKDLRRWSAIRRDGLHPVNRDELDRLMGIIKKSGAGALMQREVDFLDRLSAE